MDAVFKFIIDFLIGAINILNIEIVDYGGVSITYLGVLIVSIILPLLFAFVKSSANEATGGTSLVGSTSKIIAYNNYKNRKKGG